jgi:hypothetical protein
MIYQSADGLLEVTVSDDPDFTGHFSVQARRLRNEDFWAFINVDFRGADNSKRIDYKTQDTRHSGAWQDYDEDIESPMSRSSLPTKCQT